MTPHESPNGKFSLPGWAKPVALVATLGFAGWIVLAYVDNVERMIVLETNYVAITKMLEKIDKKVDRLYPDYGPAFDPNGGGGR